MREEDLRRDAKPLILALEESESVIGSSMEFIRGGANSYYLKCTTLLQKRSKDANKISKQIEEATGRAPAIFKKDNFPYLVWEYFVKSWK